MERNEELLKSYCEAYIKDKASLDDLKKLVDAENVNIKTLMQELDCTECEANGKIVTMSVETRVTPDEEKMIKCLKKLAPNTQCIKMREYIDMDVLENEIYHGELDTEALQALNECNQKKDIIKLTLKKAKAKKEE